jgi:hypothetical protein
MARRSRPGPYNLVAFLRTAKCRRSLLFPLLSQSHQHWCFHRSLLFSLLSQSHRHWWFRRSLLFPLAA